MLDACPSHPEREEDINRDAGRLPIQAAVENVIRVFIVAVM